MTRVGIIGGLVFVRHDGIGASARSKSQIRTNSYRTHIRSGDWKRSTSLHNDNGRAGCSEESMDVFSPSVRTASCFSNSCSSPKSMIASISAVSDRKCSNSSRLHHQSTTAPFSNEFSTSNERMSTCRARTHLCSDPSASLSVHSRRPESPQLA